MGAACPTSGARAQGSAWNGSGRDLALWHVDGGRFVAYHGDSASLDHLRGELGLPGGAAPGEVLSAAWQRWSVESLARIHGPVAMAVQDGDEILLYRDPSGLRNLFWTEGPQGRLAFATDLRSLLSLPDVERRLDRRSLHEYLHFLDITPPATLYERVHAVEAGQLLCWTPRGMERRALPDTAPTDVAPRALEDALDRLDACLRRSIEACLRDVRRPAAFLSGGVDSSLICALAGRQRPEITALTVGFEGAAYDESPVAERVAAHLGLKHEVLRFGQRDVVSAFERLCGALEQPMADPATPVTVLALDHCRDRFDTVLDGTGADESAGALPPRHLRLAVGYGSLLPATVRASLVRHMRRSRRLAGYTAILDFEHPADTLTRWRGFTRAEIESLCGEPVSFDHTRFYRTFALFPRQAHFERYSALVDTMSSDRLIVAEGVTGASLRYPFCDREVDRLLRQLRTDYPPLPGQPKRTLRALLARYVPSALWDGPKRGFTFPLHQFLASDDFVLVRRYLDPVRWHGGLVSAAGVGKVARQFIAGDARLTFRVWALVVLGAWLEKHDELH